MTTPAPTKPKKTFDISLQRYDLSIEKATVTVHYLPRIIAWNGNYYHQIGDIALCESETFYEQIRGEDLSNIRSVNSDSILHEQQQAST